ncbi:CD59 glycoprotein-like isoform X2 [Rhinoderma darwinii]
MRSTGNCCVVLAVGLVFLSLCSTGQALQCYSCDNWGSTCAAERTCAENGCVRITLSDGTSRYGCRSYDTCTIEKISQELNIQNLKLTCCQSNLCNSSFVAYPSTVLLLLAAALLMMMSS